MEMFTNAVSLFLRGKLFRDPGSVVKLQLVGVAIAAILLVTLRMLGLPLWLDVVVASAVSGALQPWLFRDLKYA
jgi:hypothetical protein